MLAVDFTSCKKSWDSFTRKCFSCFRPIRSRKRTNGKKNSESARNLKYYGNMSTEEQGETLKVAIAYCNESWKARVGNGRKSGSLGEGVGEREKRSVSVNCFSKHDCPTSFLNACRSKKEETKAKNSRISESIEMTDSEDDGENRLDIKKRNFIQKKEEKKSGILAIPIMAQACCNASSSDSIHKRSYEKKSTNPETEVMVKNRKMLRQNEHELSKKRGNQVENVPKFDGDVHVKRRNRQEIFTLSSLKKNEVGNDEKCSEITKNHKVKRRNLEGNSTALQALDDHNFPQHSG